MVERGVVAASLLAAAAAAATGYPANAAAAGRCATMPGAKCLTVRVPLDRSGAVPGRVHLHVLRIPSRHAAPRGERTALVPIVGGPGLAATQFAQYYRLLVGPGLRGRDLVLFDQRGTGKSDALRCPTLEDKTDLGSSAAGASCAQALGARRGFYHTADTVEDLEAVRRAVGARKLLVFGFSYGTEVAMRYAAAHPDHVEAIVLDGPVAPAGVDALHTAGYRAIPAMLRQLCEGRCAGVTRDPVADLAAVTAQMQNGPLTATVGGGDGYPHTITLTPGTLFGLIVGSDQTPIMRGALPAALHAAALGDPVPLARLVGDSAERHETDVDTAVYSPATYAATQCAEALLPYDRTNPDPTARATQMYETIASTPADRFWPFSAAAAVSSPMVRLCIGWPYDGRPAPSRLRRVRARALILSGEADLTTPPVNAREVARVMSQPTLVEVPDSGHGSLEKSACARQALADFLARRPVTRHCPRRLGTIGVWPLTPPAQARPGPADVLVVARQTLADVRRRVEVALETRHGFGSNFVVAGGLRGGRFIARERRVTLINVELYSGIPVSGRLRPGGTLTVGTLGTAVVDERGRVVSATPTVAPPAVPVPSVAPAG
jgi:pimeloyl-ACP methyl ester carboxylesterase